MAVIPIIPATAIVFPADILHRLLHDDGRATIIPAIVRIRTIVPRIPESRGQVHIETIGAVPAVSMMMVVVMTAMMAPMMPTVETAAVMTTMMIPGKGR